MSGAVSPIRLSLGHGGSPERDVEGDVDGLGERLSPVRSVSGGAAEAARAVALLHRVIPMALRLQGQVSAMQIELEALKAKAGTASGDLTASAVGDGAGSEMVGHTCTSEECSWKEKYFAERRVTKQLTGQLWFAKGLLTGGDGPSTSPRVDGFSPGSGVHVGGFAPETFSGGPSQPGSTGAATKVMNKKSRAKMRKESQKLRRMVLKDNRELTLDNVSAASSAAVAGDGEAGSAASAAKPNAKNGAGRAGSGKTSGTGQAHKPKSAKVPPKHAAAPPASGPTKKGKGKAASAEAGSQKTSPVPVPDRRRKKDRSGGTRGTGGSGTGTGAGDGAGGSLRDSAAEDAAVPGTFHKHRGGVSGGAEEAGGSGGGGRAADKRSRNKPHGKASTPQRSRRPQGMYIA